MNTDHIRTGIGGWSFPAWRGVFYPPGLKQASELNFASRALGAIEINSTSQSHQSPATFARWAAETPPGFIFSVKAHRACTSRRVLAEAGESVERFLGQGLTQLGDRLGPILWSFMPSKVFDEADIAAFLAMLPDEIDGARLRHCLEPRHASFADERFIAQCAARNVAVCMADSPKFPMIEADTADFAYARLMRGVEEIETGYAPDQIEAWARRFQAISAGPDGTGGRDVFAFVINGGKVRAPAAAQALARAIAAA